MAEDAIQFVLDKLPPTGYSASVWKGTEHFQRKGPMGRLASPWRP